MSSSIVVKENDELKLTSSSINLPKILSNNNIKESVILKLKEKLESSMSISEENANVEEEKNENTSNKKKKKKKKGKKKKKKVSINFKYKLKQSVDMNMKAKELLKNKYKIKNLSRSFPKLKYFKKNKNISQPNMPKIEQKMESYTKKEKGNNSKEKEKKKTNNNEEQKGDNNDNSLEKLNEKEANINIRTFNFRNKEKTLISNKKYVFGKRKKPCMTPKPKIILNPNGNEVDSMNGCHSNNYTSKYLLDKVSKLNDNLIGGIGEGIDSFANVNIRGEKNAISAAIKTNPNDKTNDSKDDKNINDKNNEKNTKKIDNNKDNSSDKDDDTTSQQKKETSEDSSNNLNVVNNFVSSNLGRSNVANNGRKNYTNHWLRSKTKFNFNDTYRRKEEMEKRLARIRKSYQDREVNQSVQNMKTYIYLILPGNASYLVKNCMCHRVNWKEPFSSVTSLYNFKWQQLSFGIDYNSLGNIVSTSKQIVNHYENHYVITNKANMFINLMNYCEKRKISVFKYLPFTIIYQFKDRVDFNKNADIVKNEAQRLEELKSFINHANKYTVNYDDIGKFYEDEKYKDDQIKREEFEKEKIKKLKKKINKIDDRKLVDAKSNNNNKDNNNIIGSSNNSEDVENLKYVSDVKVYSDFFPNVQPFEKIPKIVKDKDGNYIVEDHPEKDNEKEKDVIGKNTLVEIPNTHNTGKNIWIVKAINLNRGMCIKIATSFEQIEKIIKRFKEGVDYGFTEDDIENPKPYNNNTDFKEENDNKDINDNKDNNKEEENANKAKEEKKEKMYYCSRIIIQKYIERPLLYYGRKCDIRIWVLLTQNMKAYVFKEGHLKTCSVQFDIDSKDAFTHITNYSFQKYNYNFQKFEKGNEVPFYDFQKFIDDKCNKENYKLNVDLMNKVKEIIKLSMMSVKDKINKNNRNYQFEIFGYDFMLDENFNLFLIEINTNPGLEESSPWIKVIVPRMLDDALRLTLDQLFEPKYDFNQNYKKLDELDILENVLNNLKNNNEANEENNKDIDDKNKNKNKINNKKYISPFPVPGYEDDDNLWDFVCDLNAKDPYDENLDKNDKDNSNANKNINKEQSYTGIKHLLKKKNNQSKIL